MRLAFIGLGAMGYPMAGHLVEAGHSVTVFNRSVEKAQRWCDEFTGEYKSTIEEAVVDADGVLACVGDDVDVRQVCQQAFAAMPQHCLFIDHTTASATLAQEMSTLAALQNIGFVDAPVSGGQSGAQNGQLTIMVGGSIPDVSRAEPIMTAYAKAITHVGDVGAGQVAKMVNQVAIAGLIQGLSEALVLGQSQGLDMTKVLSAISQGAAGSWQMSNRGQTMIEDRFDFGFAVDWMRKDLAICLQAAEANGLQLEVTKLVDGYYKDIQNMGGGRWDTSSLIKRLR